MIPNPIPSGVSSGKFQEEKPDPSHRPPMTASRQGSPRQRLHQRLLALATALLLAAIAAPVATARTHTVRRGETLSSIAAHYGVSVEDLVWANRLSDKNQIVRGQKLTIPEKIGADWT
ncbi:MAG: LysM domain-containing protein, partial [Verrucomicrobia bacterium]